MDSLNKYVEIRFLTLDDINFNKNIIIELLEDNMQINFSNLRNHKSYAIKGFYDMALHKEDNSAILIGAFDERKLVGFIWAYEREVLGEKRIHINHIVVDTKIRSKGLGSKLLSFLERFSSDNNILKIDLMTTLDNKNTVEFYKSKGYSTVRVQFEKELGENNDN